MIGELKGALFRYGWDTRCRNLAPAKILRHVVADMPKQTGPVLLDVGCGLYGLAAFLPDVYVVGVDVAPPAKTTASFTFQVGNVTALPFRNRSFPVVSCVDVLEHLPVRAREQAISELTRVASRAVVIACPHGRRALDCDKEFRQASLKHGRVVPSWVEEHLRQPYPLSSTVAEQLQRAAIASGRTAKLSLSYCEPTNVCRLVRWAAARSDLLYAGVNLLLGTLLPLIPEPDAEHSYRMVLLAQLSPGGGNGDSTLGL